MKFTKIYDEITVTEDTKESKALYKTISEALDELAFSDDSFSDDISSYFSDDNDRYMDFYDALISDIHAAIKSTIKQHIK